MGRRNRIIGPLGNWWLYEELEPADDGCCELRVLLYTGRSYLALNELSITARQAEVLSAD